MKPPPFEAPEALKRLKAFASDHRRSSRASQHKANWIQESKQLQRLERRLSRDLEKSYSQEETLQGAVEEKRKLEAAQDGDRFEVRQQIQELRHCLERYRTDDRALGASHEAVRALLAELILGVREGLCEGGEALCREEEETEARCSAARRSLWQASREEATEGQASHAAGWAATEEESSLAEVLIRKELEGKLDQLIREHKEAISKLEGVGDRCAGWDKKSQARFEHIVKSSQGRTAGREKLLDRLLREFPTVTHADLLKHEAQYRNWKANQMRRLELRESLERGRVSLQNWADAQLARAREEAIERKERSINTMDLNTKRRRLQEKLRCLREQRASAAEAREAELKELQERLKQKEAADLERQQDERKAGHALVAAHKKRLAAEREAHELAAAQQRQSEELARLARMPKNVERVKFRQRVDAAKAEEKQHQQRAQEEAKEKSLAALMRIAASVPYHDAIINATPKLGETTAAVRAHFEQFAPVEKARGHHPMFGYDTRKLFTDYRFRLGLALREAGVAGSRAAHDVISKRVIGTKVRGW